MCSDYTGTGRLSEPRRPYDFSESVNVCSAIAPPDAGAPPWRSHGEPRISGHTRGQRMSCTSAHDSRIGQLRAG